MVNIHEATKLVGHCGIYCGSCGMYRGRIYAKMAQEFLEVLHAAGYPDESTINPKGDQPDFDFFEFVKEVQNTLTKKRVEPTVKHFVIKVEEWHAKIGHAPEKEESRFATHVKIPRASTFRGL